MDKAWRRFVLDLASGIQLEREKLRSILIAEKTRLRIQIDLLEPDPGEIKLQATYGQVPEVYVDSPVPQIFPQAISRPHRVSWYKTGYTARSTLQLLQHLQDSAHQWLTQSTSQSERQFGQLATQWFELNQKYILLTQEIRYLEAWVPQLERAWANEAHAGRRPASDHIIQSLFTADPRIFENLREILRPTRVMKRTFLPESLEDAPGGIVILPIATDITQKKFIAEIEGALETHWNQSFWAKTQGVSFFIRWTFLHKNTAFAAGQETLVQHLSHFPTDRASMTTGSLATHVQGQSLIFGPGKTNPRTIAHELGHLLGFGDCYMRTLSSQGIFGLGVLEWDNPLYPDDLMCDNTYGEPRVEVW